MILGIIILIIIGVIVETILIGKILTDLRVIDNMQECDKEFWEDKKQLVKVGENQYGFNNDRKRTLF